MNYYVIGIGGTGAKCIEALTHLCAAGMMPAGKLHLFFVDPDKSNGSLARTQENLQSYFECRNIDRGNIDLFKTEIERLMPDVWSPFDGGIPQLLGDAFEYDVLQNTNSAAAHLFDVLYSVAERETELNKGFRGHPSIGSAILGKTLHLKEVEPWETFRDKLENDVRGSGEGAKVFLFASVFGGTGASGFPTIPHLIKEELKSIGKAEIGGALILPYFSFTPGGSAELRASSGNFMMNTQVALKYYHQQASTKDFDAVYLFGNQSQPQVKFSLGGNTQKNAPHFLELYGAMAAINFFKSNDPKGYMMIARENENQLKWTDIPDGENGGLIKQKMTQIIKFAFAYLSSYYPILKDIGEHGNPDRAAFFVDFFERQKVLINDNSTWLMLNNIKKYCENILLWIANIQESALTDITASIDNADINLIKHHAFAEVTNDKEVFLRQPENFVLPDFNNLVLPARKSDEKALTKLWGRMSHAKVRDNNAMGVGRFIHALYRECSK